ncbi:MAG TPA: AI-2E family transporter, partial [Pyrinomonadaceae bacterium]|nr:AI-2E family transporter [Pyrinomonadaceae bacterium]
MQKRETKEVAHTAAHAAAAASWPQTRAILRIILIVLSVAIVLWLLVKLTGVILLLILSIFFAYFVYPLVEFLRRPIKLGKRQFTLPRTTAIALAYLFIIAVIIVGVYFLAPHLANQFPEFTEQARSYWVTVGERTQGWIEYFRARRMPGPLLEAINRAIPTFIEKVSLTASEVVGSMAGWLIYIPWLILIPVLSFFLLKDADTFRASA